MGTMKKNVLGQFLKQKRAEAGLTQWDVAQKLGYSSAQFISNFERGLCQPPLNQLKNIVEIYGLNPQELVDIMMQEQRSLLEKSIVGRRRGCK